MTKTEAMIGNLKLKECNSILEFLFSDLGEFSDPKNVEKHKSVPENSSKEHNVKLLSKVNISHELKNPLNCIISYAELLCKNSASLQNELKRYVENIQISAFQLKSLLLDVIESAKFEYEKIILNRQKFQTKDEIENVSRAFEEQFLGKNIKLSLALIQANVTSDKTKFNQILYNLVSNAVKYTANGGEISLVSWVEEEVFHFEIKNTTTFIKKNGAKRMFRLFQKVKKLPPQAKEGAGIGLNISKELALALGGGLEFQGTKKKVAVSFFVPVK